MSKQELSYRYTIDSRFLDEEGYINNEHAHALIKLGKAYADKYAEKRDVFVYRTNSSEKELSREEMTEKRVRRLLRKETTLTLFGDKK